MGHGNQATVISFVPLKIKLDRMTRQIYLHCFCYLCFGCGESLHELQLEVLVTPCVGDDFWAGFQETTKIRGVVRSRLQLDERLQCEAKITAHTTPFHTSKFFGCQKRECRICSGSGPVESDRKRAIWVCNWKPRLGMRTSCRGRGG